MMLRRIHATLLALPCAFLLGILLYFFPGLGLILWAVGFFVYLFAVLAYFPMLYRRTFALVSRRWITWQTGFFFQTTLSLEVERIQSAQISQTPLQRLFKLCSLTLQPVGRPVRLRNLTGGDALFLKRMAERGGSLDG